jgi:hypothetical protein
LRIGLFRRTDQRRQLGAFVRGQVLGILEPEEARALEVRLVGTGQLPPRLAPDFIDSPPEMLAKMEPIEDEGRARQVAGDGVDVDAPHVAADGVDRARSALPQPCEEALHRGRVAIPAHPHDPAAVEVVDDREVSAALCGG